MNRADFSLGTDGDADGRLDSGLAFDGDFAWFFEDGSHHRVVGRDGNGAEVGLAAGEDDHAARALVFLNLAEGNGLRIDTNERLDEGVYVENLCRVGRVVAGDGDLGMLLITAVVRVEGNLDFASFAWSKGAFGESGNGAATGASSLKNFKWSDTRVGELEDVILGRIVADFSKVFGGFGEGDSAA